MDDVPGRFLVWVNFRDLPAKLRIPCMPSCFALDISEEPINYKCLILSFYISSQESSDSGGEVILGGVDTSLYSGQVYWTPVTQELYWQIGIDE